MSAWSATRVRDLIARLGTTQAGLGRLTGVREDTVRQVWCRDGVPDKGAARTALDLLAARIIEPPPAASLSVDMDRDGPASDALDPHLDDLAARAEAAGWHPAEVVAAVTGWAIHRAVDGAGADAARELLDNAGEIVALR